MAGLVHPAELLVSGPLLLLWLAAPAVGWWISRPLADRRRPVRGATRVPARSGPPDLALLRNDGQRGRELAAARQSPGNPEPPRRLPHLADQHRHGLLANLSARDFGYLSTGELLDRTEQTLTTMARLERYRGHFYNWYDTRTLKPLPPLYVSSVDSGNLAGWAAC
jgi:cyclic beta-1,2-glucan synthetase